MNFFNNLKIGTKMLVEYIFFCILTVILGIYSIDSMRKIALGDTISYRTKANMVIILVVVICSIVLIMGVRFSKYVNNKLKVLKNVADKLVTGETDVEVNSASNDEIGELLKTFQKIVYNNKEQANIVKEISKGNFDVEIKPKSDKDVLGMSLLKIYDTIKHVSFQINELKQAVLYGKLDTRADVNGLNGGYKDIIGGINTMLEEIVNPLNECEEVIKEMSKGNLQVSVKGNYKGKMAVMKDEINHLSNEIYEHIEETSNVLMEMAKGNLDVEITGAYHGDFVDLKESINKIIASFNETLGEINTAAEQVSAGTKQVSDSSQSLSQGSTEQAASVEEITASVTEIAAQTKENATNANKANEMAESIKKNAGEGNREMQNVLKAMEEINISSNNISKIIKVIDDIAFQTNILALNAAVEAARAGQHGKGFAVVSEEVRNLAARSANAAKETTDMIEESIKKAEHGKKITELTAEALKKVTENITLVVDVINGIAVASNDQASAIGQINQAIEEVSKVTQTNTATAEETASASEELSSQAVLVKERVGSFILKKVSLPNTSYKNIDDKTLKIIQDMLKNKTDENYNSAYAEAAATSSSKINISLDDKEFGKY